jgi:hypothetical protein
LSEGRVFFITIYDQAVAVDAASGQKLWQVRLDDYTQGETLTMAPLLVKGEVLIGSSGVNSARAAS